MYCGQFTLFPLQPLAAIHAISVGQGFALLDLDLSSGQAFLSKLGATPLLQDGTWSIILHICALLLIGLFCRTDSRQSNPFFFFLRRGCSTRPVLVDFADHGSGVVGWHAQCHLSVLPMWTTVQVV